MTYHSSVNPVASKCFALGLQLGVQYPQICTIENDYRKSKDQLREIISERLKQDSPLTWHNIVTALQSPTVGENSLASQVECVHIRNLQPFISVAPQVSTVSSVLPTSSSLMLGENLLPVRVSLGGQHSMTPQQMGPQHRGNYQPPTQTLAQVRGPQHRGNYQPPKQMMGQVRGPPHRENYHPPTPMLGQVRGPQRWENYQPPTQIGQVRAPPHRKSYHPPAPMLGQVRGPQCWGNYQPPTQIGQVRGPPHGENYHLPTPMLGQVKGPQHRGNYQPPKQMIGQVRGHHIERVGGNSL